MVIVKISVSRMTIIQLFLLIVFAGSAIADLTGPFPVVEGKFGTSPTEFAISHDDMGDSVPSIRSINVLGNIFLVDNEQVKIFDYRGQLLQIVKPKNIKDTHGWPAFMDADSHNNIYTSNYDNKLQKYSIRGELLWEKEVIVGRIAVQPDDTIIIWGYRPDKKGAEALLLFSSTGQLLKTYTERPLELGVVESKGAATGQYKYETTIKYPDHTYHIFSNQPFVKYCRDGLKNLYRTETYVEKRGNEEIIRYKLYRYDRCSEEAVIFNMPISEYEPMPPQASNLPTWIPVPIIEYGEPIISPSGDLYCWARTKTEYKILKWTWQGPADAPQSLKVSPSQTGLSLTWDLPQKDANSVTSYEINRSGTVCGPFRPIGTVKKDRLTYEDQGVKPGETWYYQVRAMREKTPSGYSNKAVGTR